MHLFKECTSFIMYSLIVSYLPFHFGSLLICGGELSFRFMECTSFIMYYYSLIINLKINLCEILNTE